MMTPAIITVIPSYVIVRSLGLLNSIAGVCLPLLSTPTSVFLFKIFVDSIPNEVIESAKIDGAGYMRIWASIIIPLSIPMIGVIIVLNFWTAWYNFLWPIIALQSPSSYTFPVGLFHSFRTAYFVEKTPIIAGALIAQIPVMILVLLFATYFIKGVTFIVAKR